MYEQNKKCYSHSALMECRSAVNAFNWTVNKKADHFPKCIELRKLFDFCYRKTGCMLFDADFSYQLEDYERMARHVENFTNVQLCKSLKCCRLFLEGEIVAIHNAMLNGEVDTIP